MDEKANDKSETLALLRNLTKAEPVLLILNLLLGANTALVRGLHVTVLHERWSTAVETVPVGAALAFLCVFGLFLTAGVGLLRRALIEIIYLNAFDKARARWKGSSEPTRTQLLGTGCVPQKLILEKANRESNDHYSVMHQEHEEAMQEQWVVSLYALCTIVLLIFDWWRDGTNSIAVGVLGFLDGNVARWTGWALGAFAFCLLFRLFLVPIISVNSDWIYCPGFPDPIDDDVAKVKLATSIGPPNSDGRYSDRQSYVPPPAVSL
jgi:hypothetical protein